MSKLIEYTIQADKPSLKIKHGQPILRIDDVQPHELWAIKLTNQYRQIHGLPVLTPNWQLSHVARLKAEDLRNNNYNVHISPTFGSPFDMIRAFGISFKSAAENIAGGQVTPEEVINAWINQPTHRANLLNLQFNEIGIGYAQGGYYGHYWSQMFIG